MLYGHSTDLIDTELVSVSASAEAFDQLHGSYQDQQDQRHVSREVTESVAAALLNAEAALRWLVKQPANIDEVKRALVRVIDDSRRAAHVLKKDRYPI
jgi:hypothetical protein